MHNRVDLIGSNGIIGNLILNYLKSKGIVVREITKEPGDHSIGFNEFLNIDKSELIIDVSLMSIQDAIKLRQSLENSKSRLVHISSVSALYDDSPYGQYKRSVYRAFKEYENSEIYFGDIFEYDNKIIGFWKKINRNSKRIYSFRNLHVFNIEKLSRHIYIGKRYKPEAIKVNLIKRSFVSLSFKTRVYRFLNLFGIYIIK